MNDWRETTQGQDMLEQLECDLNEILERFEKEYKDCVFRHLDYFFALGYEDGQEAGEDD